MKKYHLLPFPLLLVILGLSVFRYFQFYTFCMGCDSKFRHIYLRNELDEQIQEKIKSIKQFTIYFSQLDFDSGDINYELSEYFPQNLAVQLFRASFVISTELAPDEIEKIVEKKLAEIQLSGYFIVNNTHKNSNIYCYELFDKTQLAFEVYKTVILDTETVAVEDINRINQLIPGNQLLYKIDVRYETKLPIKIFLSKQIIPAFWLKPCQDITP